MMILAVGAVTVFAECENYVTDDNDDEEDDDEKMKFFKKIFC